MVRCARCHRVITDPAAIEAGYGAKCYAKEFGKKLKSPARPRKAWVSKPAPIVYGAKGGDQEWTIRCVGEFAPE